jgi:putative flippase GtrA
LFKLQNTGSRFLVVGGISFSVDTFLYFAGLQIGLDASFSKALSFIAGMTITFFLNRQYTFQTREAKYGKVSFVALYGVSLLINVSVNSMMLSFFNDSPIPVHFLAFLVASLIAVFINYFGLKYVVFRK